MTWNDLARPRSAPPGDETAAARVDNRTNLLVAEYNAIRAVMAQKSAASHALVGAYLTVVAVILGFVVANRADPRLLLAVPVLAAISGITILRRRRDREAANTYIREVLRPVAVECSGDDRVFRWDDFYAQQRGARSLLYEFGLQLVFPLSGFVGLFVTLPLLGSVGDWSAWLTGLAFLVALLSAYVRQNRAHLGRSVSGARARARAVARTVRGLR
ncbi:hypothetical protein GCE86_28635 [Micromonospora terminaliae]|uniref:Uncharacterized protein n=1 Tax=Micromonospora terminaliae TaxID=1914461 RepID=A0AAJ2ZBS0_9ACTN|nr:hypothetical protein [Micromonospora terminaliae]NES26469.1 hypothetical protein [Micromonospora terminaliae]QGL50644.1 hypothetical protein GCE86_28635 [Micromonospora terminaliae]